MGADRERARLIENKCIVRDCEVAYSPSTPAPPSSSGPEGERQIGLETHYSGTYMRVEEKRVHAPGEGLGYVMVSDDTSSTAGNHIPRLFKYSYSGMAGSSPPFSCLRCSVCSACSDSTLRTQRAVTATANGGYQYKMIASHYLNGLLTDGDTDEIACGDNDVKLTVTLQSARPT